MKNNPIVVLKSSVWLNLITPITVVKIIVNPAKDAYVIPIGNTFITFDNAYIHKIIVTPLIIEGIQIVKPSAFFAKLFDVTPRKIANNKKKYGVAEFIKI